MQASGATMVKLHDSPGMVGTTAFGAPLPIASAERKKSMKEKGVLEDISAPLEKALNRLNETTMALGMKGMQDQEEAAAVASNYLNLFALTTLGYLWARMAVAASEQSGKFFTTKIKMARYYFTNILPEADSIHAIINAGKASMMDFDEDEF